MNRYTVAVDAQHEGASATPDGAASERGAIARGAPLPVPDGSLAARQRWLVGFITADAEPAVDEEQARTVVTRGPRLEALERLAIYRRGYRARLTECLADDYPTLRHALGGDAFDALSALYVERFPSTHPSLNAFGRHMAALCRDASTDLGPLPRAFCADLASLEWGIVEVVHAPSAPPLTLADLGAVAPGDWPEARLVANTAVRLLRFDFPVNAYLQTVRDGGYSALPVARDSATVVYRSGATIWRMDLTTPMFLVLSALLDGVALEEALGRAEPALAHLGEAAVAERVTSWFQEWVASGLFVGVSTPARSL